MRTITLLLILAGLVPAAVSQEKDTPATPVLETTGQKISYALGRNIGNQLKKLNPDLDRKTLFAAIAAALDGDEQLLTDEEIRAAFSAYEAEVKDRNQAAADKFLATNAEKDGVKTTKSGLQYLVLKAGDGDTPTKKDKVAAHYRGMLINGTVFDQSYEGKTPVAGEQPVPFGVTQVIGGWTEALQLMKVGAHYRLFIPPNLAYGARGTPDRPGSPGIPPNSLLIFDIRLVSIE